jgi:hypothetical protein
MDATQGLESRDAWPEWPLPRSFDEDSRILFATTLRLLLDS